MVRMEVTFHPDLCLELRIIAVIQMGSRLRGVIHKTQVYDGNIVMFRTVQVKTGVGGRKFIKFYQFKGLLS